MKEIKVSANFVLQGRTLLAQEEAETLEKEKSGNGFNREQVIIYDHNQKKKLTFGFSTRKQKTITQTLNIDKTAYAYMTSKESCPTSTTMFVWGKLNKQERLKKHLELIASSLCGILKDFVVFDD